MTDTPLPTVGFIGLGLMGSGMALNVMKAGFPLVVNDVRREAATAHLEQGATWAGTPRALAQQCDVIVSCLPSLAAIEQVALGPDGLVHGVRDGAAYFEMSTNSPALVKRLHAAFAGRGAHMLDAPISGGALGAQRGRLGIWVGGDKASFVRYEAVLRAMGDAPLYVGTVGAGVTTKLVNNCASQIAYASLAEVFALGVKAGAEPLALWEAMRQGAQGRRRTYDGLVDEFLPNKYEPPHAALRITHKDMMLATEMGRELGVPMRLANATLAELQEAMNMGWSERDCRSIMALPQMRAGVQIAVRPEDIEDVLRRDPPAPTDTKRGH